MVCTQGVQNNGNTWITDELLCSVHRDHDEYGFKIIPDYEVEDMKLLAKIQALEIRSHNLLHQVGPLTCTLESLPVHRTPHLYT